MATNKSVFSLQRAIPWFVSASVLLASVAVRAQSPYDARQRELAQKVEQHGHEPAAAIDLLRMIRLESEVDPELSLALFRRLAESPRLDPAQRMMARRQVAWDLRRSADPERSREAFAALGYVRQFRVLGPFDNEGKRGFDEPMAVERHPTAAVELQAAYQGRERMVRWRVIPDVMHGGYVSLDALLRPAQNVCALAETTLRFPKARTITLWLGAGGAMRVLWNGQEVFADAAYRSHYADRSVVSIAARAGDNRLLVKSCVHEGAWGFSVRVGDERGEPLVVPALPEELGAASADAKPALVPGGPRSPFFALEQAIEGPRPRAQALEDLARFLAYTGSDDPAAPRARDFARRAAEAAPNKDRYLLLSRLSEERYEKMRYIARAEALAPRDPQVILARAAITQLGPSSERSLRMLDAVVDKGIHGLEADELRISMLRQLGLTRAAEAIARKAVSRVPRSTAWLERLADLLALEPNRDELIELEHSILALRRDHVGARRLVIDDLIARQQGSEAEAQLAALRDLFPWDEKRLLFVADGYEALGRDDLALATLHQALEVVPESDALHVREGRMLLRAGLTDRARQSFARALELRPQDAETRELLEQLAPAPRRDEAYALAAEALLARRRSSSGHPVTVLQELTVRTVYPNGLGSAFVQQAAQIHDEEGARRMRARSIQFDPESQRIEVRLARVYRKDGSVLEATETYEQELGEPWYRIYYDTRALVVVFPDLEPGDSVELRYRIDDVAPRNLFANYFGDFHFLQSEEPRAHVEYVVIAPETRKLFFNTPRLASLKRTTTNEQGLRIDRFVAEDVPPIKSEPDLPGLSEIAAYLHVSTYETWSEVGRFWWGLVRDQLQADEALRHTVKELVAGAADEREKIRRIYGWVVKNTRYVALEFGIHGFMPYRVPEIVRRGFGDCKDKASLIYTMLHEAGIDARLVLVRTRRNGAIHDLPASLAVFDHAIAYVPAYNLYLDGTAEHSGTTELPAGDQGVTVLVVGPTSAELKRSPVLPADTNTRERRVTLALDREGGARVETQETISGVDAAAYRQTYQAEGTRKDRYERALSGAYPGVSLESLSMTGLDDIEKNITVRHVLKAPQVAQREGDELRIAASALRDLLREMAAPPARVSPLELGVPRNFHEVRTLLPPQGFAPRALPRGGEVKGRFGLFSLELTAQGGRVAAETAFRIDVDQVAASDYAEFRRFIEQIDEILRQRVSFAAESQR